MLRLTGVTRTYRTGRTEVHALRGVDLEVDWGEYVAIMGPSGSGKSTLLHLLGFLDRPDSGEYRLMDRDVTGLPDGDLALMRNRLVGFVFQQFHLLPRVSALDNTALPLVYAARSRPRRAAAAGLAAVGLSQRLDHRPNELSGGEQQRVAVARALVNDPFLVLADEPTGNLDSKSGAEIISLLDELNRRGKTVILVTHEREIAERAQRLVRMQDGRIVSDSGASKRPAAAPAQAERLEKVLAGGAAAGGGALLSDHAIQAVRSIMAHKLRAILSTLGVLVGVAAVVAMMAVAEGARDSIRGGLAALGSNMLVVKAGARRVHGVALESGVVTRFTREDADAMGRLPSIRRAAPFVTRKCQVEYGSRNWVANVEGRTTEYVPMHNAAPVAGRFFSAEEVDHRERVAVLGTTVVQELFGRANPVGETITINRMYFTVIGVLPSKGGSSFHDWDDVVVIPLTTAMYRLMGVSYVGYIELEVRDRALMPEAKRQIEDLVARRQNWTERTEDGVVIRDMTEIQNIVTGTTRTMGWLLASVALISLAVGGIGIMNIMLVAVGERTGEIGLRKALGARGRDIMAQFLVESVIMTLAGGAVGIGVGSAIAGVLARLAEWPVRVSMHAVLGAAVFSAFVGILFGLWPARQAARLDPISALRYE